MSSFIKIFLFIIVFSHTGFAQIHKIFADKPKKYSIFGNSVNVRGDYLVTTSKELYSSPYHLKYLKAYLFKYENKKWIQKDTLRGAIYNQTFNDLGLAYVGLTDNTVFFRNIHKKDSTTEMVVYAYDISNDKFDLIDSITSEKKLTGTINLLTAYGDWLFIRTNNTVQSTRTMIDYFYKKENQKWEFFDSLQHTACSNHAGLFRTQMDDNFIVTSYTTSNNPFPGKHILVYKFIEGEWKIYDDIPNQGGSSMAFTEDHKYIAYGWSDTIKILKFDNGKYNLFQILKPESLLSTTIFANSLAISNGNLYSGYYDYIYNGNHGEVYQYILKNEKWNLKRKLKPIYPDSTFWHFGESLSIWEDRLAIGADYDFTYGQNRGAVYIYDTPSRQYIVDTICEGEIYLFQGDTFDQTGIYIDTLLTSYDLDSIITLNLTVIPQEQIFLDTLLCNGDTLIVGDSIITESGFYEFYYNKIHGCESFVRANIEIENLEVSDSIFPDFGCNSGKILIDINGTNPPYSFKWNSGQTNKDPDNLASGTYQLQIVSKGNCKYNYEYDVPLKAPIAIVPNAFFPNGSNEINKTFRVFLSDTNYVNIISTQIFDRWGEKVFESKGNDFWNGIYKNREASPEVYLYKIEINSPCGKETKIGQVILLK